MFINWQLLMKRAEAARDRMLPLKEDEIEFARLDSIDAVILSVISLEAFINEVSEIAYLSTIGNPTQVYSFGKMLRESEEAKASLKLKYMLTYQIFTGSSYDDSKKPFQDMHLLIELRNAIVHFKPLDKIEKSNEGKLVQSPNKLLNKLRSKNILSDLRKKHDDNLITSWLYEVATRQTADWACETSRGVIESTVSVIPECQLKDMLNQTLVFVDSVNSNNA